MTLFRKSVLVAIVVLLTVAVIASPVFATPNITASSGTAPVTPFFTPVTSTRSQFRGTSANVVLTVPGVYRITCRDSLISGYASTTHTQLRLTEVSFRVCASSIAGSTVDGGGTICPATSGSPWFLHARSTDPRSSVTTVNLTSACFFIVTLNDARRSSCTTRLDVGSSIASTYTSGATTLAINGAVSATVFGGSCPIPPRSVVATLTGTYTFTPDTARDGRLNITGGS